MTSSKKKYHFIGIGGSGMSGVAQICLAQGYPVSGSDLKQSMATNRLESKGAIISFPHNHSNITEDPVVVVSSAIPETNEVEVNLWGGDAPALILGIDSHLAHHGIF